MDEENVNMVRLNVVIALVITSFCWGVMLGLWAL